MFDWSLMRRPTTPVLIIPAALLALALAGCSPATPAAEDAEPTTTASPTPEETAPEPEAEADAQTVAEACAAIDEGMTALAARLESTFTDPNITPEQIGDVFGTVQTELDGIAQPIENAEVRGALDGAIGALDAVVETYGDVLADPENADFAAFEEAITNIGVDFAAIDTVCA